MSTTTENVDADVTESSAEVVTATETTQIKKVRHSPLHITVVLPNNRRILIPSVNPSEPTSYLKQTLQEYHESAQYTSYTFETADKVTISDYVEIANYSPPDEEVSTMVVHLVPSHYDVRKSRLQLKRVREMIAYPPNAKGAIADSETGAEKTEAAAVTTSIISPVRDAAEQDGVDLSKEIETLQLESPSNEVTESKSDMPCAPAIAPTAKEINPTTAVSSDEVAPVKVVEGTAADPASLSQESTVSPVLAVKTVIDLTQNKEEKTLSLIVDCESSDDHNSPSNESKDGSSLELEEEKPIIVEVKSSILDDDGIKVTGMDAVVEPEIKQHTNVNDNVRKLPSEKSIFRPILLSEFFSETLLRVGSNEGANNHKNAEVTSENKGSIKVKAPSECVRSVSASGWNPPPLGRKLQGDLLYIEAVTGTFPVLLPLLLFFLYSSYIIIAAMCVHCVELDYIRLFDVTVI
jgi:Mitochondrial function, CLU-N-term